MRLMLLGRRAPFPVADRARDGDLYESMHPRLAAIRLLREKIAAGQAGLDPYQPSDFIVVAAANELRWARISVNYCGLVLTEFEQPGGGARFRVVLESDVRADLGLDSADPPYMADEPLASRRVDGADCADALATAAVYALNAPQHTQLITGEPLSLAALRAAKHAAALSYDCSCGAPAGFTCKCSDDDRIASNGRSAS